jgi:hypothetical protein
MRAYGKNVVIAAHKDHFFGPDVPEHDPTIWKIAKRNPVSQIHSWSVFHVCASITLKPVQSARRNLSEASNAARNLPQICRGMTADDNVNSWDFGRAIRRHFRQGTPARQSMAQIC